MIPYPRQALSELCFRQRDMEKGAKFQLCFVLLCTPPFTYPSRWRHKSVHSCNSFPADKVLCTHGKKKNMACLFFATLLCLSVVCNNVLYGVLYLGTCNKILYVLYREKLYCCSLKRYSCFFSHLRTFEVILISGAAQGGDSETK